MTPTIAGIAIAALLLSSSAPTTTDTASTGSRVESDSYTDPQQVARCIAYNIQRKMPELRVRNQAADSPDDSGYLILTAAEPSPATFGVIRVDRRDAGSHLTTWLRGASLSAAPEDVARRLVAGC